MPLVQVATFREPHTAHAARALLESDGIEARLGDEHLIGNNWLYSQVIGGVKLLVAPGDAEAARSVLESAAPPGHESAEAAREADELDDDTRCPQCGALGESADDLDRRLRAFSLLAVPLPFTIGRYRMRCTACAHSWRAVPAHRGVLWVLAEPDARGVVRRQRQHGITIGPDHLRIRHPAVVVAELLRVLQQLPVVDLGCDHCAELHVGLLH